MDVIRKVSVGPDYKNAMHYQIGQDVLRSDYTIFLIMRNKDDHHKIDVWIESIKTKEKMKWKQFPDHLCSIEFSIDFDGE